MANTITDIMPKILAKGLDVLRKRAVMPRMVNSDYSQDAANYGDTINIPDVSSIGTLDVSAAATPATNANSVRKTIPLTLNKWRQSQPFFLTDKEMLEIDRNRSFIPQRVAESAEALASYINGQIMALYLGIWNYVGNAAYDPFTSDVGNIKSATEARRVLNENKAPLTMRRGVLDFVGEARALELDAFRSADQIFSKDVIMEGEIGRKLGIDWAADDDVPKHTKAAAGTVLVDFGAGYAAETDPDVKTSTIHLDGVTTLPAVGDVFTFAGHTQTYVIKSTSVLSTNDCDVTFAPALKTAIVDDEALTFKATHRVNLVFHRDAFAFAMRPLASAGQGMELGTKIMSMTDPVTGLSLRLEMKRQHKQTVWEFDVLFGCALIRPELAVRLAGKP